MYRYHGRSQRREPQELPGMEARNVPSRGSQWLNSRGVERMALPDPARIPSSPDAVTIILPTLTHPSPSAHIFLHTRRSRYMSSSVRFSPHRRRSHSATSPVPSSRQFSADKWRTSCKRPRASNTRSPSLRDFASDLPADKWDVEKWRRGKKARRDSSVSVLVVGDKYHGTGH